jgi:hypothetical protein
MNWCQVFPNKPSRAEEARSFAEAGVLKPAHTVGEKGSLSRLGRERGRREPL